MGTATSQDIDSGSKGQEQNNVQSGDSFGSLPDQQGQDKSSLTSDVVRLMDDSGSQQLPLVNHEEEVETAADTLTSLIEPFMMVFLGGIIAVLVVAMYLPVFNMANTVSG